MEIERDELKHLSNLRDASVGTGEGRLIVRGCQYGVKSPPLHGN
jgi:hypothetical protein